MGPSASESTADQGLVDRAPLNRLRFLWEKSGARQVEFEPLRQAYIRAGNDDISGGRFLRLVYFLTTQEDAPPLPTGVPGIQRHAVQIPGTRCAVQVLRRDDGDGFLADLRIAKSIEPGEVRRDAMAMQRQAKVSATRRATLRATLAKRKKAGSSSAAGRSRTQQTPHQRIWLFRKAQLASLHQEYVATLRGKKKEFSGAQLIELLQQLAGEPGSSVPTEMDGIDRCSVRLQGIDRNIQFLMHREPGGTLTDLRLVPSPEEELYLLDEMERFQKRRITRSGQQVVWTPEERYQLLQSKQWRHLAPVLQAQFRAHVDGLHSQHESRAGISTFMRHLDDSCQKEGGKVVDAQHGIRRHVLRLEGSDEPVTLLRRITSDGPPTLRYVGSGPMDEALAISDIVRYIRTRQVRTEREAQAEPPPDAVPAATEPPASTRARARRRVQAEQLTRALEVMVANKEACKPNLLEGADHAAGLDGPTLRSWLAHDGKLRRSLDLMPDSLPGFLVERAAIHQHLSALGHENQAACLPQPLSADLVAAVLQARIDHPSATNAASLARLTGGNWDVIRRATDPGTGALRISDHRLQHLPGYDTHWEAIRDALRALGHTDRANGLPRPPTAGEQFVRALREDIYPMAAAVNAMQAEPGLSVREAARRVSDSAKLAKRLERLVAPGGKVRSRAKIEAKLPDLKLHCHKQELSGLLRQLEPAVPSRMRRVLVPGFANFGAKLFIVNKTDDGAGVQSTTRKGLPVIYADSPELVVPPRSFRHDRAQQALRWLSTVLKKEFGTIEVQCYFDAKRQDVWVSSNNEGVNRKIEAFLDSGGLKRRLEQGGADAVGSREGRHLSKLARKLAEPEAGAAMAPVLQAMAQARFCVPTDTVHQHGKAIDLHAERRIKDAFKEATGEALTLRWLAGTMRPCTVCAKALGLPPSAHRGPAWLSRAAQAFYDANEIVERNVAQSIGTYASLTRAGKLSVNYNTDSESSDDGAAHAPHPVGLQASSSAPSTSSGVLGKRKARGPRIGEPGEPSQPSGRSQPRELREPPAPVEPRAVPAQNAAGTLTELTRHLDAWSWPSSPAATTWRPASPPQPASPTD
ncbi:MAG: hypothetical protein JF606_24490, partial [Burkholderiales bacterium]|nr:hypothetical protein [Burkholderiales bacterium]